LDLEIVGTWFPVTATEDGGFVSMAEALGWDAGVTYASIQFNSNATFTYSTYDATGTPVEAENGTWETEWPEITLAFPDEAVELEYNSVLGVLSITDATDLSTTVTCWLQHQVLNEHEAGLVGAWEVTEITVEGATVDINGFSGLDPDSTDAVFELFANGTVHAEELKDSTVVSQDDATWATGGRVFYVEGSDLILANGWGIWDPGLLYLNIFDPTTGAQIKFSCGFWNP